MFGIVVTVAKGVAAGGIVCGALKVIDGTAAETRTAIGAVAMTGTAGRGGEGKERWRQVEGVMSVSVAVD